MSCSLCASTPRNPQYISEVRCAFDEDGVFIPANWNCSTMNVLRTLCDDYFYKAPPGSLRFFNDQTCAVIPYEPEDLGVGSFIVLGWYKMRGRAESASLLSEEKCSVLRLADAEACIAYWRGRGLEELK